MIRATSMQLFVASCLVLSAIGVQAEDEAKSKKNAQAVTPEGLEFYEAKVKPILTKHCLKCHGGEKKIRGGLRLTHREGLLEGGDTGPAISLDEPDESLLLNAINYEDYEMPPSGKLPAAKRDVIARWVRLGAPMPSGGKPAAKESHSPQVNEETKKFWAFRRAKRPGVPPVKQQDWGRQPIDAFVLQKLEAAGLKPSPRADKLTLLRRACYDLTGLPPTPQQIEEFLQDDSPKAYEKLIDRLLASQHYGERWARHWLDVVRYAESNSYERDGAKPFVWRYRDYVIRSFNDDKPYDEFIRQQLAGDEFEDMTPEDLIATGYYRLGIWQDEPVDPVQELYEDLDDIVTTTSQVFLGLTLNCSRCHDHKLDPLPQRDYYRFMAFFHGLNRYGIRGANTVANFSLRPIGSKEDRARQEKEVKRHREEVKRVVKEIVEIEKLVRGDFQPVEVQDFRDEKRKIDIVKRRVPKILSEKRFAEYVALKKRQRELRRYKPKALGQALCVTEIGREPRETFVLIRGNAHARGDRVEPGFPSVLDFDEPQIPAPAANAKTSGRRTALANWIASPENPLTPRVLVNRLWQHHFGRGIVRSPNNFGFQGDAPTHRELLDWLAVDFVEGGWKLKRMHKQIMLSNAYQMSSRANDAGLKADPENNLFWRFNMRRLAAEEIRDSILAVNGSLNSKMFGPSVYPLIPAAVKHGQSQPGAGWGESSPEDRARRSIYVHIKRSLPLPLLAAFDVADADTTCPVRFSTTQPTQALGSMNGEFLNDQAEVFANNLQKQAGDDTAAQVKLALTRALQRPPRDREIERGVELIQHLKSKRGVDDDKALKFFCLVVLNLNEMIYLD